MGFGFLGKVEQKLPTIFWGRNVTKECESDVQQRLKNSKTFGSKLRHLVGQVK